jgi:hypothetical protein
VNKEKQTIYIIFLADWEGEGVRVCFRGDADREAEVMIDAPIGKGIGQSSSCFQARHHVFQAPSETRLDGAWKAVHRPIIPH